jgi:hypothetical protein
MILHPELRCHDSFGFPIFSLVLTSISRTCVSLRMSTCCRSDSLKRVMTYLLLHHPDALVSTTFPLKLGPSPPNGSDSHSFNSPKSLLSPYCDNCAVTSFVRCQKAICLVGEDIFRQNTPISLNIAPPTVDVQTGFPHTIIIRRMEPFFLLL